jgi:3-methylcrotonyl-CoA carboxylase alpha subunit
MEGQPPPTTARRRICRLLIANRGEIACRVIRTARRLGIHTIAVHSIADANALHTELADEAVLIGSGPAAADSYLDIGAVLRAAAQSRADAVHPGYGFLSENAAFAAACDAANLTFVGPRASTIASMGNKKAVKQLLAERCPAVPLIPGSDSRKRTSGGGGGGDDKEASLYSWLCDEIERIGLPVLLKAVSGGGGKGMRVVHSVREAKQAMRSVRVEAKNSFGDSEFIVEKYFARCRHIEIQIFGDVHGNVVSLGERDCSLQRRYQKVLEETPSPATSYVVQL